LHRAQLQKANLGTGGVGGYPVKGMKIAQLADADIDKYTQLPQGCKRHCARTLNS
jgi:hypothetical protein